MFDVASSEVIILGVVALLVIPPKDLPKAMRFAGHWVGKVRGIATQFRSGFDSMVREAELHEMEKKWAEENARIMREHPPSEPVMVPLHGPHTALTDESGAFTAAEADDDPPAVTVEPPVVAPSSTDHEPATDPRAHL